MRLALISDIHSNLEAFEAVERAVALGFSEEDLLRTLQGRLRMKTANENTGIPPGRKTADRSYL